MTEHDGTAQHNLSKNLQDSFARTLYPKEVPSRVY